MQRGKRAQSILFPLMESARNEVDEEEHSNAAERVFLTSTIHFARVYATHSYTSTATTTAQDVKGGEENINDVNDIHVFRVFRSIGSFSLVDVFDRRICVLNHPTPLIISIEDWNTFNGC
jgi:hypothetical protein